MIAGLDTTPLHPAAPATLEECGLTLDLVAELVLKALAVGGELGGTELAGRLGLSYAAFAPALEFLKAQQQCHIVAGSLVGAASYRYRITDAGRIRAAMLLANSQYVGVAPVPLAHYRAYMEAFRAATRDVVTRARVREAFVHLVIHPRVLDQLGPAINAGHSMFVYGPPGNGKTVISQGIRTLLPGDIWIPHALEVEGQIVRLFDPGSHEPVSRSDEGEWLTAIDVGDRRWVRCRRPMVTVGGELRLESLELTYNAGTGLYRAPVQTIANGGVLVIDDFGRQLCAPRDLLNRWIVPLESRVDYLSLHTGQKFEMPFMTMIVFATNIRPNDLVDEAFLRRIQYKILAESPTVGEFRRIFDRCCRELGVTSEPNLVERLLADFYRPRNIPLRGCQPRDLIAHALSLADYRESPRHLTLELVKAAAGSYFVDDREEVPVYA